MADETLREALEAAYDEAEREDAPDSPEESGGSTEDTPEPVRDTAPTEKSEPEGTTEQEPSGDDGEAVDEPEVQAKEETSDQPAESTSTEAEVSPEPEPQPSIRAPESWKPNAREHWAKLPADVQAEVQRREREITLTLQQTAEQRKLADEFSKATLPFQQMIAAEGSTPVKAAGELFRTAALLRVGTPIQKAQLVADMVKNFGIDIEQLDHALAGEQIPDEEAKFAKLLDERLAPVQQLLQNVEQAKTTQQTEAQTAITKEIEEFSGTHEFFGDVRETMADLMDLASKRGQALTLEQAYEKACQITPEVADTIRSRAEKKLAEKKEAASSLPSSPPPASKGRPENASLRDDIEHSIAELANR